MKERGFEVHAVSSPGNLLREVASRENIPVHAVEMPRRITPLKDLVALYKLWSLFRRLSPAIIHAHTPKGGLLGVIAGRMARVPAVIYTIHGLPFTTAMGLKRWLLGLTETVSCHLAHRVFAVSYDNRQQAVTAGLCPRNKIKVLASGSCNGVDAKNLFNPGKLASGIREKTRQSCQIPEDSLVLGYVGRIVRDKGLVELQEAWQVLRSRFSNLYLLLVGPEEPQDPIPQEILYRLKQDPKVRFTGWIGDPTPFYAAMDILVLPTYREGFPVVPLEAAAMQLPVVATTVGGCTEAVAAGITGLLVSPKDTHGLIEAIQLLLLHTELRTQMGQAGRERVLRQFKPELICQMLHHDYLDLLSCGLKKIKALGDPAHNRSQD